MEKGTIKGGGKREIWYDLVKFIGLTCCIFADKHSILDKEILKRKRCLIILDFCFFQWSVPS